MSKLSDKVLALFDDPSATSAEKKRALSHLSETELSTILMSLNNPKDKNKMNTSFFQNLPNFILLSQTKLPEGWLFAISFDNPENSEKVSSQVFTDDDFNFHNEENIPAVLTQENNETFLEFYTHGTFVSRIKLDKRGLQCCDKCLDSTWNEEDLLDDNDCCYKLDNEDKFDTEHKCCSCNKCECEPVCCSCEPLCIVNENLYEQPTL